MKTKTKSRRKSIAWNKGQLIGQKLPLTLKEVRAIRSHLKSAQNMRDLVLFNLAIESSLNACDLVSLRIRDISKGRNIATQVAIMPSQANYPVQFEISDETRESISVWAAEAKLKPEHHLFPSRLSASPHISVRQYARIVAAWVGLIGLDPDVYGTQSLRRTKPMLMYRQTKNLEAVQLLLGHARIRSTARFLGINIDV